MTSFTICVVYELYCAALFSVIHAAKSPSAGRPSGVLQGRKDRSGRSSEGLAEVVVSELKVSDMGVTCGGGALSRSLGKIRDEHGASLGPPLRSSSEGIVLLIGRCSMNGLRLPSRMRSTAPAAVLRRHPRSLGCVASKAMRLLRRTLTLSSV